jgi:hypothetical protein
MNLTFQVRITGDNNKEVGQFVRAIAFGSEAQMKILMTEPKSGRQYKRGDKTHTASKAGESPAVDTSFLINSIEVPPSMMSDTEATITISAEYAEILEFYKDRPFVRVAIDHVLKQFASGDVLAGLRE